MLTRETYTALLAAMPAWRTRRPYEYATLPEKEPRERPKRRRHEAEHRGRRR